MSREDSAEWMDRVAVRVVIPPQIGVVATISPTGEIRVDKGDWLDSDLASIHGRPDQCVGHSQDL